MGYVRMLFCDLEPNNSAHPSIHDATNLCASLGRISAGYSPDTDTDAPFELGPSLGTNEHPIRTENLRI